MTKKAETRVQGLHTYRFEKNPLERAFAEEWDKENQGDTALTDALIRPSGASAEEYAAAATVVQWLGSPVGQSFLAKVLSRKEAKEFRRLLANKLDEWKISGSD